MDTDRVAYQQANIRDYVLAEINEQSSKKILKRFFWICVHATSVAFAVSALLGTMRISAREVGYMPLVAVKSNVSFPIHEDSADPNKVLALVNTKRAETGLNEIAADSLLSNLAEERASDMVENSYYAHKDMSGKIFYDLMTDKGVTPQFACENLSLEPSGAPQISVESWSASTKGHRECMLDPRVVKGGYASVKLYDVYMNGAMTPLYLVVAVHSTDK